MKNIKNSKFVKNVAFLLGMLVCNDVIYAFKVGGTYINVSFVFGVILFLIIMFTNRNEIKFAFKSMNSYFKIFSLITFISIVPATIVFASQLEKLSSYFNGIIAFILYFILYIDILILRDYKKDMLKGLAFGFLCNIILSLIQYITYQSGNYFSLYTLFPQPAFQINSYYGVKTAIQQSPDTFDVFAYRAQGFFLETSYYYAFLVSSAVVLFVDLKKSMVKMICAISLLFIILLTSSGNMIIIIFTFVLYFIAKRLKKQKYCDENNRVKKTYKKKDIFYVFVVIGVILIIGMVNYSNIEKLILENNVYQKFFNNINTANITDEGNKGRFTSMMMSLQLVPDYPMGIGYNMSPTLIREEFGKLVEANTTFNQLIKIQLETGFLGTIVYLFFIYSISVQLILKANHKRGLAIGIAVLGTFICQVGNGIGFYPFVIFIFALANIEMNEIRQEKIERE